ncbi:tripartite tricarboxylate transporter TctB family protein [Marinobacterium rhizophilum]|uniref:Tripartite tricarboxylate transporter TctB family protein n=1 Tax=Marinobacterium rhizophilum TaxID=420402 RepID=A0ABY5HD95_9GAMM|nr:tripartite tricarboxylate transporter TctB family protein [Marinobacterium rhizophilum]UTW10240.1 tripartite tricarboxylate transporter TctB family protein [Marinobacterium rhizophilum]
MTFSPVLLEELAAPILKKELQYLEVGRMSWKKLNNIMSIIIMIIGMSYVINLNYSASQAILLSNGIGPTYFPNVLAAILFFLCVVVLIQGNIREDTRVTIPNIKYMVFTLILTMVFILSWQYLGYFYINAFVFITALMTVYRKEYGIKKSFLVGVGTSIVTTGFLYVLFGKILFISL